MKAIAGQVVAKQAPELSVAHAKTADTATSAATATSATSAANAQHATTANTATHATTADSATNATSAASAANSTQLNGRSDTAYRNRVAYAGGGSTSWVVNTVAQQVVGPVTVTVPTDVSNVLVTGMAVPRWRREPDRLAVAGQHLQPERRQLRPPCLRQQRPPDLGGCRHGRRGDAW